VVSPTCFLEASLASILACKAHPTKSAAVVLLDASIVLSPAQRLITDAEFVLQLVMLEI
jgi:hypothetical protein